MNVRLQTLALGCLAFLASSLFQPASNAAGIVTQDVPPIATQCTVDWNTVHQRIDGFGASSAWQGTWTTALADMFFSTNKGIGLSLLRNHITPTGGTVETSIMQMAQARGARVWSTPWSPPTTVKSANPIGVVSVNGGAFVSSTNNFLIYARQLASYVTSMKNSYGINLYALSMQNEPDVNTTDYESCIWTAQQFHDFIPYLATALSNQNVSATKIISAEDEHWQFDLTTTTINDSNTAPLVGILAAHNYGSSATPVITNGKDLWETEVSLLTGNDSSISNGVYWAGQIHQFLTIAQVNAWHYWWLINGTTDGNQTLLDTNGTPAKRMYALGNFSKFIRPNFYRIGLYSNTGPLQVSAYKDPVSSNFVVVAINATTNPVTQAFNLYNFTAGTVTPWITSSNLSLTSNAPIAVTASAFTSVLSPMSIVTFVGQANRAPNTPTNLLPTNLSINQPLTPTLQASPFNDPDVGNTQAASEWRILRAADNSPTFDSGSDTNDLSSLIVPDGVLDYGTTYDWQVRDQDNFGAWSSYSTSTTFSTSQLNLLATWENGNLTLSWPANISGFSLQYTTSLDLSQANWLPVPFAPVVIGDFNVFTNTLTNSSAVFFRLKKP